jgi:phosphatidylinositol-3-phosphatase
MNRRHALQTRRLSGRRPLLVMAGVLVLVAALAGTGASVAANASTGRHGKHPRVHHRTHHVVTRNKVRDLSQAPPATMPAIRSGKVCGSLVAHPSHITHVIWIVMENQSFSQVMTAPYISSLAAQCGVATNYHNVSHPSLPNYIAMTSGRPMGRLPTTDCPTFCPISGSSIFTQTSSWRVYAESMPGHCVRHDVRPYVVHHTAAPYYTSVTNCSTNDVPLTALNLAALPRFSLIIPNVYDDMHPGSSSVAAGDKWLRTHLGAILASPAYRSGSTAVFLTWDEGGTPRSTNNCATNTTDPGCHVALLVMSPYIHPGTRWTALANHYSLLQETERLLGLPYLQQAASAPSIRAAFDL